MLKLNNNLYQNKKADIAITLLVVLVFFLCITAAFIFLTKQSNYDRDMKQFQAISGTDAREEAFIFYLKTIAENIIKSDSNINAKTFIDNFQATYFMDNVPEYAPFKSQITDNSKYKLEIRNNKLYFSLNNFDFSSGFTYDPGTESMLYRFIPLGDTPRLEITNVKHTSDIVFEI